MKAITDKALAEITPTIDAMCNTRKIGRCWQNDKDLYAHLCVIVLESLTDYVPDTSATLSTFISSKLRYAILDYIRNEKMHGLVTGHDVKDTPVFISTDQQSPSDDEEQSEDYDMQEDHRGMSESEIRGLDGNERILLEMLAESALASVTESDRSILLDYFGLQDHTPITLQELAKKHGWQYPETARRRVASAIDKCRAVLGIEE